MKYVVRILVTIAVLLVFMASTLLFYYELSPTAENILLVVEWILILACVVYIGINLFQLVRSFFNRRTKVKQ